MGLEDKLLMLGASTMRRVLLGWTLSFSLHHTPFQDLCGRSRRSIASHRPTLASDKSMVSLDQWNDFKIE